MRGSLTLLLLSCLLATAQADDAVSVPGSTTTFPTRQVHTQGVAPLVTRTTLTLTGAGMRKTLWVKVYALGSYVDARATASTAAALIATPHLKQLQLVFQRDLSGPLMASSIVSSVRAVEKQMGKPGLFDAELARLEAYLAAKSVKAGDTVRLTHLPQRGLRCQVAQHSPLAIQGDPFARAVWTIYFGKKPLQDDLKRALTSRLKPPASRPAQPR